MVSPINSKDRITITDEVDVSDLKYSSLETVVERLTDLRAEGYTDFDVETYNDYGSIAVELKVTRRRLENDEEYAQRMAWIQANRQRRYKAYLELREEFGDLTEG